MKMIWRAGLALIIIVLVLVVGVVGVMLGDAFGFEQAADASNVTYVAADGTTLVGYLAEPPAAPPEPLHPAVLMVHEWWGLNHEINEMADILAAEGYTVLAPDTYRGRVATGVPGALYLRLSVPVERVNSDMQAAFEFLSLQPGVDPTRIAVIGFCYGGGVALRHATQNPLIAATVNLYGDTIDIVEGFGALLTSGRPLLGVFGEVDQQIPLSEVDLFSQTLAQTSIPYTVTVYPGVGHAFVTPQAIQQAGAAQDAWNDIKRFLATAFTPA
jgi:carboxymethylenebutenolidase